MTTATLHLDQATNTGWAVWLDQEHRSPRPVATGVWRYKGLPGDPCAVAAFVAERVAEVQKLHPPFAVVTVEAVEVVRFQARHQNPAVFLATLAGALITNLQAAGFQAEFQSVAAVRRRFKLHTNKAFIYAARARGPLEFDGKVCEQADAATALVHGAYWWSSRDLAPTGGP